MMYRPSRRAAAFVAGAVIVLASGLAAAQPVSEPMNEHPNPYTTINHHFKLPEGRSWGSTSAVDIDPDGGRVGEAKRQARPAAIALVSFAAVNDVGVVNRQDPRLQLERVLINVARPNLQHTAQSAAPNRIRSLSGPPARGCRRRRRRGGRRGRCWQAMELLLSSGTYFSVLVTYCF